MKKQPHGRGPAKRRFRASFKRAGDWLCAIGQGVRRIAGSLLSARTEPANDGPGCESSTRWRIITENLPALVVGLTGLTISIAAYLAAHFYYDNAAKQDLERQAAHHIAVVTSAIERRTDLMTATADLFADSSRRMDRWSFFEFAREQLPTHPGLSAFFWAPRMNAANRAQFEREAEEDGLFGFQITERDLSERLVPAGYRSEYFPAYFVEPFEGNEKLLGYDVMSDSFYAAEFEKARAMGRLHVASSGELTGTDLYNSGILMVQPVYASIGAPSDDPFETRILTGFIAGLVQTGVMIDASTDEFTTPAWLDLYLYDVTGEAEAKLLHYRPSPLRSEPSRPLPLAMALKGMVSTATYDIADRNWLILVRPVSGTVNSGSNLVPQGVGIIGALLTCLLLFYVISTRNRRRVIEATVTERTAELSATNVSLKKEVRQRRRVEHELRAAKDQAEIANRTKSEFLAMVSHELRTPLNAILGFSEIMSSEMYGKLGDEKYRGYAVDIQSSGEHLLGLINNILDLSKVEAREFELDDEEINIPEAIDEALRFVADAAKKAKVAIKKALPANLPLLNADQRAIRQILINLLSNAVKFTPARGQVTVGAELGGNGSFVLFVADTGIGIPPEHIERVLQPFAQVDSSLARKFEGTGLGLPLTKSLVELHGGVLELDSDPRKGTTVRAIFDRSRVVESVEAAE